jgi:hypothetical protein
MVIGKYPSLDSLPWVVGVSRMNFTGRITGVQQPGIEHGAPPVPSQGGNPGRCRYCMSA